MLPQCVECESCGFILYDGESLSPIDEIFEKYDGKCPKCGKTLAMAPINFKVKPTPNK